MKRLYQLVAAIVVSLLIPVAIGAPSFAASTCDVGFTGPDSKNLCTSIETYKCSVTNQNDITIKDTNNQTVASGKVTVSGNGSGGGAISGTAGNSNSATFLVTVKNSTETGGPSVCSVAVTVPAKETPATVAPTKPATNSTAAPRALPVTGDDSTLTITAIVAGMMALIAGLSVGGVLVYRRIQSL